MARVAKPGDWGIDVRLLFVAPHTTERISLESPAVLWMLDGTVDVGIANGATERLMAGSHRELDLGLDWTLTSSSDGLAAAFIVVARPNWYGAPDYEGSPPPRNLLPAAARGDESQSARSFGWPSLLERWTEAALAHPEIDDMAGGAAARDLGGFAFPGASEEDIVAAEARLGVRFPPSYREFLRVSNG